MSELFSVSGKRVVITGGTSGIGLMMARAFVAGGAEVIVASRKADACAATEAELSAIGSCVAIPADLSTEDGCRGLASAVAERWDSLDVLINNAGATWGAPLADHDERAWEKVLAVNVKGVAHLTRFLVPLLQVSGTADSPSRIINVGSINGLTPPPMDTFAYSASKAAVHQLSRHLAKSLAPTITVNAIAPGPFESRMMAATLEAFGDHIAAGVPLKRIGSPDDIAGAAIFLSSRAGAYVTGAVLPVDGGMDSLN